jgi:hypothetical protein
MHHRWLRQHRHTGGHGGRQPNRYRGCHGDDDTGGSNFNADSLSNQHYTPNRHRDI